MSFVKDELALLQKLPWYKPLTDWNKRDSNFMTIKSGLSRHVVRFVKVRNKAFAIKETSGRTAQREFDSYIRLHQMGINTLRTVGLVIREDSPLFIETQVGTQIEPSETGYIITELLEYSIPHYFLFKRSFNKENRQRIWDAIAVEYDDYFCQSKISRNRYSDCSARGISRR